MGYAEQVLPEFDAEMANTRKVLELVPNEKLDWQATDTTHTIGWNANHLAEIPGWVEGTLTQESWDINPPGGEPYQSPKLPSIGDILAEFDKNVAMARNAIEQVADEALDKPWSLLSQGEAMFTMPRRTVMRNFVLNHTVHHRAILLTYLRLNGIKVPGMYGPGA